MLEPARRHRSAPEAPPSAGNEEQRESVSPSQRWPRAPEARWYATRVRARAPARQGASRGSGPVVIRFRKSWCRRARTAVASMTKDDGVSARRCGPAAPSIPTASRRIPPPRGPIAFAFRKGEGNGPGSVNFAASLPPLYRFQLSLKSPFSPFIVCSYTFRNPLLSPFQPDFPFSTTPFFYRSNLLVPPFSGIYTCCPYILGSPPPISSAPIPNAFFISSGFVE